MIFTKNVKIAKLNVLHDLKICVFLKQLKVRLSLDVPINLNCQNNSEQTSFMKNILPIICYEKRQIQVQWQYVSPDHADTFFSEKSRIRRNYLSAETRKVNFFAKQYINRISI